MSQWVDEEGEGCTHVPSRSGDGELQRKEPETGSKRESGSLSEVRERRIVLADLADY